MPAAAARSRTSTSWIAPLDKGPQRLIGLPPPFQPTPIDNEHVDVPVAYRGLSSALVAVLVNSDVDLIGVALGPKHLGELVRDGTDEADVTHARAVVEHRGQHDHADDEQQHHGHRDPERP